MEVPCSFSLRRPVSVTFIITYACNIVCEHCDLCRFRELELSTAEVKSMLAEISSLGVRSLSFEGGEPLLRPDIGELISFTRDCGMRPALVTNGTLVKKSLPKLAGLGRLFVSLEWADAFMDGGPGYAGSLSAMEAARSAGLEVAASVVLTKANISALPAILADCASVGVDMRFTRLLRHIHSRDNSRIGSIVPGGAELEAALGLLASRKKRWGGVVVQGLLAGGASFDRFSDGCPFVITPSGDVAPCYGMLCAEKWTNGRDKGFKAAFLESGAFNCPAEWECQPQSSRFSGWSRLANEDESSVPSRFSVINGGEP